MKIPADFGAAEYNERNNLFNPEYKYDVFSFVLLTLFASYEF